MMIFYRFIVEGGGGLVVAGPGALLVCVWNERRGVSGDWILDSVG